MYFLMNQILQTIFLCNDDNNIIIIAKLTTIAAVKFKSPVTIKKKIWMNIQNIILYEMLLEIFHHNLFALAL